MMGPFRNHPIVIIKTLLVSLAVILFVAVAVDKKIVILPALIIVAAIDFITLRVWYKTSYTFDDHEISVIKSTAFKADKTIPYSKISAVNRTRSVWDRIAGTESVKVNINSGVNATRPEITLVLKTALSEELYRYINERMYGVEPEEGPEEEPHEIQKITFTNFDTILHGLLSNPTASLIVSAIFLAYSIFDLTSIKGGSLSGFMSFIMFAINLILPMLMQIIRYFDFVVYRDGDRIFLEHGLFSKYHSSFEISRINAIRIRQPLLARLFKLSAVQAEVVGINAVASDATPTLCLMTTESKFRSIMEQLIPEFTYDSEFIKQPSEARAPVFIKSIIASAIVVVTAIVISIVMIAVDIDNYIRLIVITIASVSAIVVTFMLIVCGFKSLQNKGISFGKDMFTIVDGVVDRTTTILYYDRVQMTDVRQGPLARHFELSVCKVFFLSAMGNVGIAKIGYLPVETASRVGEILMRRLKDGTYDYRLNDV